MDPNNPNPINPSDHAARARGYVYDYVKSRLEKTDKHVTFGPDEVYVVSFTFVLGSWKALVSTTLPDGMYYEVTHNKAREETYLDAYKKFDNVVFRENPMNDGEFRDARTGQYVAKGYAEDNPDTTVHES